MMNFSQDTDSQNRSGSPGQPRPSVGTGDVTTGVNEQSFLFTLRGEPDPTRDVESLLARVDNRSVAEQASRLLATIQRMITLTGRAKGDARDIPPLRACLDEDGAVLIEWIFSDFRIGFNIEPNEEDSGWHLISNRRLGDVAVSKPLPKDLVNMSETVALLVDFIVSNT